MNKDHKLTNTLLEEYRIIQNKIDKIGEFEFKVRGWAITLESALIISLMTGKIPLGLSWYLFLLMAIIVLIFQFLEEKQREIKRALVSRVFIIEKAIDRIVVNRSESRKKKNAIDRNVFDKLKGSPRIAVTLRNYGRRRSANAFKRMFTFKTHVFYYAQYFVILTLLVSFLAYHITDKQNAKKDVTTNSKVYSVETSNKKTINNNKEDGKLSEKKYHFF